MKCITCGRFVSNVWATKNDFTEEITEVRGVCSQCGDVDLMNGDWSYEDFEFEENENT